LKLNSAVNDYHNNKKSSTVQTPLFLSDHLFYKLPERLQKGKCLDIGCNKGNLSRLYHEKIGVDPMDWSNEFTGEFIHKSFMETTKLDYSFIPDIGVSNSPFNTEGNKKYSVLIDTKLGKYRCRMISMHFAIHFFELFGYDKPLMLFASVGFCNNQKLHNKGAHGWKRYTFLKECGAKITGKVSLPLDVWNTKEEHIIYKTRYDEIHRNKDLSKDEKKVQKRQLADEMRIILFPSEVIFFNIPGIEPFNWI
jgi:hypothetical protein